MENVCLYDFVAYYDWQGKDDNGNRKYRKLTKPRLPNHKLFDPENEAQREDYYYSQDACLTKYITTSFTNSSTKPMNAVVNSNHFICFSVVLQGLANRFLLKR